MVVVPYDQVSDYLEFQQHVHYVVNMVGQTIGQLEEKEPNFFAMDANHNSGPNETSPNLTCCPYCTVTIPRYDVTFQIVAELLYDQNICTPEVYYLDTYHRLYDQLVSIIEERLNRILV